MKPATERDQIPAAVKDKLNELRQLGRRVALVTALFRGATFLLGAMLIAMAIDWWLVLFDARWRWALMLVALTVAALGFIITGLLPVLRKRSLVSLARQIDLANPILEERLMTVTEFAGSKDASAIRGSEALLQKVAAEASTLAKGISPASVVSRTAMHQAMGYLGIAIGVLALFLLIDSSATKTLCKRFWAPGSNITLTQVRSLTGNLVIGKGESLTLEFVTTGKVKDSASLFVRSSNGRTDHVSLNRNAALKKFTYAKNSIGDSFEYQARAGDGETAWHHVTVAQRPILKQVKLRLSPPAYSHLPVVEEQTLVRKLRALEGTVLEATFEPDQQLAGFLLSISDGTSRLLTQSADHLYHFTALLTNSFTLTPFLTNLHRLENHPKTSCEIVVYRDEAPVVKMLSPTEEITARPDDVVKIEFQAQDDFGIAEAKLLVTVKTETNTISTAIPIPLDQERGGKRIHKLVDLDLKQFHLKQDQELTYAVQVTDTKEHMAMVSPGEANANTNQVAQSDSGNANANTNRTAQSGSENGNANTNQVAQSSSGEGTANTNHVAQSSSGNGNANTNQVAQSSSGNGNANTNLAVQSEKPERSEAEAKSQKQPGASSQNNKLLASKSQKQNSEALSPPPNNMAMRRLDAGQCSACQPRRILVDEWGRSFEGQMHEKLEIAIDPTLKLLDELLGKARQLTDSTRSNVDSSTGLPLTQQPSIDTAKGHLRKADSSVTELKGKCQDTPYAFIGLQLHDIRDTYISPARQHLADLAFEAAKVTDDSTHLEQASFQIQQARTKLADLTRSYESVKRDYKLADAMQRLQKMHQVFLEDSQAMLGSKKPPLNSVQRKIAEVDDAYVEKLRKVLEAKKKIMAELAKILADDPRLLRRFMAIEELEGTTLRDQMTLLAARQETIAKQGARWSSTETKDKASVLSELVVAQGPEQGDLAALSAKMHENMVTWLPLDVDPQAPPVADCRNLAADAARLSAEAASQDLQEPTNTAATAALNSLEQVRLLHARLPELEDLPDSGPKLGMFVANRMSEAGNLVTRQSGWLKKIEALRQGDYSQATEVDQNRLAVDTAELSEKLDSTAAMVGRLSDEIQAKANELNRTVHDRILPEETAATDALSSNAVPVAASHQTQAVTAFADAEKQFDELLRMIVAKIDDAPPPTEPCPNKTLEELLAMLEDEAKACEKLGIPCRPINVSILKDWLKPSSCSGLAAAMAQARSAQMQARMAAEKARLARQQARNVAQRRASEMAGPQLAASTSGPKRPARSWNTLVSQLGDELRQGRDNIPPEQYRQAIEQYFNTISERLPVSSSSTNQIER